MTAAAGVPEDDGLGCPAGGRVREVMTGEAVQAAAREVWTEVAEVVEGRVEMAAWSVAMENPAAAASLVEKVERRVEVTATEIHKDPDSVRSPPSSRARDSHCRS